MLNFNDPSPNPPAQPVRIAYCITDLDPGGAERALFELVTRLDRAHWEPRVYCLGPEASLADQLRDRGIAVECFDATPKDFFRVVSQLTDRLRSFRPSLLHSFLFHANIVGRFAGRRAEVPVLISGHRVAEKEKRWHLWLDRLTRKWTDHHLCVSRGVAEHIQRKVGVPSSQITVIPNGVNPPKLEPDINPLPELGIPADAPVILCAGRLHRQKNYGMLLKAFEIVHQHQPEVHLLIVGEGPLRSELEWAIANSTHRDHVHLAGYREDLLQIMAYSSVFALTSQWEGMPNVLLEAMAIGLAVVTVDVEGVRDVVEHERTGLVVTAGSTKGFADALLRILGDEPLGTSLAEAAQDDVTKRFTWENSVSRQVELYQRLLMDQRS